MTFSVAKRLEQVDFSATIELSDRVRVLRAQGRNIISMANARPDFATPSQICEAAINALRIPHTYTTYTASRGLEELREAIARKLQDENGLSVDPTHDILVTAGEREALYLALQAFINPGDEVLVLDPGWVTYAASITLAGGIPVSIPLRYEHQYHPQKEDVIAVVTTKTRAMILNTPNNPTGAVFTPQEMQMFADLAIKHNLLVITDEIYEHFIYDDSTHISIATLPGMWERTITTNSTSKGWAMTGWRIGYAIAPEALIKPMLRIHQHLISSPCAFAQKGAVTAFDAARDNVRVMMDAYRQRRDLLAQALLQMPEVEVAIPQGACFFMPRFKVDMTDWELTYAFLEKGGLAFTPGSAFGSQGKGYLRLSFAGINANQISEIIRRMGLVLKEECR